MAVRVTQTMLNDNMLRNLSKSMKNMDRLQNQLSSGRKISRPSDDPVIAARGMMYRSQLAENDQFQRNVNEAQSWLELSDKALEEANSILQRVRELAVYSGDGSLAGDSLKAMAEEIRQIKDHLGNIANQTIGGRYIFAGTDTRTPPYQNGDFVNTNSTEIKLEMNQGVFLPINVNGQDIFNYPNNGSNVFKLLESLAADLEAGKPVNDRLDEIDEQIDNLLAVRATLGARMNRMELIKGRLENESVSLQTLMSNNEDVDIAEVITELKMQENVHRAALGAGARIIQPSLMDFLR